MSKRTLVFVRATALFILVVVPLVVSACGSASPATGPKPAIPTATAPSAVSKAVASSVPQGPAAIVNGQEIPMASYLRDVEQRKQALQQQGVNLNTPEGQAQLAQQKQMALDTMIDNVLVMQDAARQGVQVTDAELDAAMQKIIQETGGQAKFEERVRLNGQTMDEARETQRLGMLYLKMVDRVTGSLTTAEQVHARHIQVDSPSAAQALLAQLQAGADFAQLAQQNSLDTTTKANGGDLGWFARGTLTLKEVEDAAFSLQPGQISNVVQSAFGYHIVQTLERDPARKLEGDVLIKAREQAVENWLNSLRGQAKVQRLAGQ